MQHVETLGSSLLYVRIHTFKSGLAMLCIVSASCESSTEAELAIVSEAVGARGGDVTAILKLKSFNIVLSRNDIKACH